MDALGGITGLPVAHYEYYGNETTYCVWAEEREQSSVQGDNFKTNQAIQGTIDLYTKEEFSPYFDAIQNALIVNKISFYFNSTQFEEDTGLIHHEWVFGV